jgi:hypothetical protein
MQLKSLLLALALIAAPLAVRAANCPGYSFILTNGQTADANQVMGNFNTIMNCANNVLAPISALTNLAPINAPAFTGGISVSGATALQGTTISGALSVTTETAGQVSINNGALGASLNLIGNAATNRQIIYQSGGGVRWVIVADSATESGGNAGTNLDILRYTDGGVSIDSPLNITRSTGQVSMGDGAAIGANNVVVTPAPGDNSTHIASTAFVANLVPSQTGNAGKALVTDGTSTSWSSGSVTAWANVSCNGSGCTVLAGSNVASVTRNSTGNYTVNFTNAYADTNYAPFVTSRLNIFMSVTGDTTGGVTVAYVSSTDGGFSFQVVGS